MDSLEPAPNDRYPVCPHCGRADRSVIKRWDGKERCDQCDHKFPLPVAEAVNPWKFPCVSECCRVSPKTIWDE